MVFKEASSFRDTAGQIVIDNGVYLREVNPIYMPEYQCLMSSGLCGVLVSEGLLIPHAEVGVSGSRLVLKPEQVSFVSYPYEWCFSMLKEAAVNTLKINRIALEHGMMLKDASAFNMQFHKGKMTLIDTLSFIRYEDGQPWGAYLQFIKHFLTPLLLMKYRDASLAKLSEAFIDGIPINLVAKLLPLRTRLNPFLLAHLYAQGIKLDGDNLPKEVRMPRTNLNALLDSLEGLVNGLKYKLRSAWTLYDSCSYSVPAFASKCVVVKDMLEEIPIALDNRLCDIGANTGVFSDMASDMGYEVIAIDNDHDCIEFLKGSSPGILGLTVDLLNPTPAIGWGNTERKSFLDRLDVDTIVALALVHHICIGNNIPLSKLAELLAGHCNHLVIEFVPLDDPKADILATNKTFPPYSRGIFESEFGKRFEIVAQKDIEDSCRSVYLMSSKPSV